MYSGGTATRGTPGVFAWGTGERILSWDAGDFRDHKIKRLASPEGEEEDNTERGGRDTLSIWKSEEDMQTTMSRFEDAGPGFQEPGSTQVTQSKEKRHSSPRSDLRGAWTLAARSSPATF
ncbi:hypothetical protein NDU88_003488 [Pleurodeles waltl]|uniref:Uncharacterized protein n=1 Tax=Pleurodeles waltl TaxID=8319 RepID=A0AAV7WT63_PLEWA|nr:hypothetical protein NDU88_003488 [Pleurodeles waltl]